MSEFFIVLSCFLLLFNPKTITSKTTSNSLALELHHQNEASNCCHKLSRLPYPKGHCSNVCIEEFELLNFLQKSCNENNENNNLKVSCTRQTLTNAKYQTILRLENFCGKPLSIPENDEMWECLLLSKYLSDIDETILPKEIVSNDFEKNSKIPTSLKSTHKSYDLGMNPAKKFCCDRAESETCRHLCHKTYGNDWLDSSNSFRSYCQHFWDQNLRQCLQDSENVCRYGCETKMSFCHHYNNQFRLFRKCNRKTDMEAEKTYKRWLSTNVIQNSIVPGIELHFRNMTKCRPDAWRRLACHLHVQPCLPETHSSNICRLSCIELIRECLDYDKDINVEPEMVCRIFAELPPESSIIIDENDNKECIDFVYENSKNTKNIMLNKSTYEASPSVKIDNQNVCFENDCFKHNQICFRPRISSECSIRSLSKSKDVKRCQKTCIIGKLKELQIAEGDTVMIVSSTELSINDNLSNIENLHDKKDMIESRCYNICTCKTLSSNSSSSSLNYSEHHHYDGDDDDDSSESKNHHSPYHSNTNNNIDCDFYCFDKNLNNSGMILFNRFLSHSSLLNSFDKNSIVYEDYLNYLPFCNDLVNQKHTEQFIKTRFCKQRNNKKVQKSRDHFGTYFKYSFRKNYPTGIRLLCFDSNLERCTEIGLPETSLFSLNSNTDNLVEIIYARDIFIAFNGIVCDNKGNKHSLMNDDELIYSRKSSIHLAYPGPCLSCCSLFGPVCGRDGRNYASDCVARSYRVGVDYSSLCSNVHWKCSTISTGCPLSSQKLIPGTRCPFCGSVVYFIIQPLYAYLVPKQDRYHFSQKYYPKLTISYIVEQFHQLSSINCEILAHKPIYNILAISFIPEYSSNSTIYKSRSKSCHSEMIRIKTLFKKRSPRIELWFPLNILHYNSNIENNLKQIFATKNSSFKYKSIFNHNNKYLLIFLYIFILNNL